MFIGQYEHSVDQKGRAAVPAEFRRHLVDGSIITKGLDGCLFLFPKNKWQSLAKNIGELPISKSAARLYARLILANASEVEFDNQGRILIPAYLRGYATIKTKIIFTGVYDRIEIWDKQSWKKLSEKTDKSVGEIVEQLSELGV